MQKKSVRRQDPVPSELYYIEVVNERDRESVFSVAAWEGITLSKPTLMPDENHCPRPVYLVSDRVVHTIESDPMKFGNPKIYIKMPGKFGITLKQSS